MAIQGNRYWLIFVLIFQIATSFSQNNDRAAAIIEIRYKNLIIDAQEQYHLGNLKKAEKTALKCSKLKPQSAAPFYLISRIKKDRFLNQEYLKYSEMTYFRDTANIDYLKNLITACEENNKVQLSKKYIQKILQVSESYEYRLAYAVTFLAENDLKSALEQIRIVEFQNPDEESVFRIRYQIFQMYNMPDSSINELKKILKKDPDNIQYRISLIDLLIDKNFTEEAKNQLDSCEFYDPLNEDYLKKRVDYTLKNMPDSVMSSISKVMNNSRLSEDRKIELLYYAQQKSQTNLVDSITASRILSFKDLKKSGTRDFLLAEYYKYLKNDSLQRKYLFSFILDDKHNAFSWYLLLYNEYLAKDYVNLLSLCDTAKVYIKSYLPDYFQTLVLYDQKEYEKVLKKGKMIKFGQIDDLSVKTTLYNMLAFSSYELNKKRKSYKYYSKIIKEDKTNTLALNNYAYFLSLDKKHLRKAEKMSRITIESEPANSTYLDTYAWILFMMDKYSEAKYYILEAIKNGGSDNHEIMDHYAEILILNGNIQNAVNVWQTIVKDKPDPAIDKKIQKYRIK